MSLKDLLVVMSESQYVRIHRTDFVGWCTTRLFVGRVGNALKVIKDYYEAKVRMVRVSVDEYEEIYVYIEVLEE